MTVIAIDICPERIEIARNNARVYGVEHKIDFMVGDFYEMAPYLKADAVFLSPPWGGPKFMRLPVYDLSYLQPKNGEELYLAARQISKKIAIFLPRHTNIDQVS